jgi:hypothetical protein
MDRAESEDGGEDSVRSVDLSCIADIDLHRVGPLSGKSAARHRDHLRVDIERLHVPGTKGLQDDLDSNAASAAYCKHRPPATRPPSCSKRGATEYR